ncbi:MAG: hypothetical protein S4CHLAM7_15020 [Chlamydiae bacterium]|nr:hypothetical protein [Chlamydiota bacterium]
MTQSFEKVGDRYNDFEIKRNLYVDELQCRLKIVEHIPSKAQIIQLENEDEENVFCLALRTLPENSNGVAHILEHTVLCGSKKFPVKDPFFSMNRRSLNTYMNALTAPDFTCYPAASQVEKDFYNLLEVYLDAVFDPQLKELSFLQEGHRLEFSSPEDPKSPLEYKGIVYNEMKGALTSPISRLWQAMMESLFPDLLYRYNFGGDPKEIPSLSYQELLDFHKKFYDKSRCSFYFYGNIPIQKHLDFLEANVFKEAKEQPLLPLNSLQKPFEKPQEVRLPYPVAEHEDISEKTYVALSWMTCPLVDQVDVLAFHILDVILMGTDAAPLKKEILKSNLCHNVFSNFEDELSQIPYSIIFEGCKPGLLEPLKKLTYETLEKIASQPINPEWIEAALHQLEFNRTEISGDYGPFGLSLILKLIPLKNVGANLENNLKIHSLFDHLRKDLQNPDYLPSLIRKYLLENNHASTLEMFPDKKLTQKEDEEEKSRLNEIKSKLTAPEIEHIIKKAAELNEFQNKQEKQDLEVLPKVTLKDVSLKPKELRLNQEKIGNSTIYYSPCFTNNILYFDLFYKLPKIDFEDLPYARLFTYLLPQTGAADRNYEENLRLIQSHTGGISCYIDTFIPAEDLNSFSPQLVIQGKSLKHKKEHLLSIIYDLATSPNFDDEERLEELLSQHFSELDHDLKQNSLRYATNLSYSNLSVQSYVNYFWFGLGYYECIRKIARNFKQEFPKLKEKLNKFKDTLLHGHNPHLICSCDEKMFKDLKEQKFGKLSELPQKDYTPFSRDFSPHQVPSQGRISSAPVFFTATSIKTKGFQDPDVPFLSIAAKLFDNTLLHRLIREQGGAYGGGASNRMGSGKFGFYAYRDPNLASTLLAFHQAAKKIAEGDFSSRELEEAKLGILQKLDHPILPEYRAYTAYTWEMEGKNIQMRQAVRTSILSATAEDIQRAVKEKVLPHLKTATTVTFSSKEKLEEENKKLIENDMQPLEIVST